MLASSMKGGQIVLPSSSIDIAFGRFKNDLKDVKRFIYKELTSHIGKANARLIVES